MGSHSLVIYAKQKGQCYLADTKWYLTNGFCAPALCDTVGDVEIYGGDFVEAVFCIDWWWADDY